MSKTYKGVGGMELPNDEFPAKITKGFYRVLEENSEDAAEIGAYKLLANAIKTCEGNPGSCVVADAGVRIYQQGEEDTPVEPDTPDTPTDPDTPDVPVVPDDPIDPDDPGTDDPTEPDTPDDPTEPDKPDDPAEPDTPTDPEVPTEVVGYAKLKTLPTDIEEAARIDGANGFNLIRYITIPYIMPVLKRVITLGFVWTFNAFSIIYSISSRILC